MRDSTTDLPLDGLEVTLSDGQTIMTNTDGFYEFTGLPCYVDYTVSYVNDTDHISDSAQHNQTEQIAIDVTTNPDVVTTDFTSNPTYLSPDNNF